MVISHRPVTGVSDRTLHNAELQRLKDEGKYIRISESEDHSCGEPEPDESVIRQ